MSESYYISVEAQQSYFVVLRIIFSISIILHLISLLFLTKFTPKNQATWRNYMMFVQFCLIAIDVYMELLFVMVPLFPAPCGYCTGPLCRLGVPLQIQTGMGFFLLGLLNTSVLFCVIHRHQSILVSASPLRLREISRRIVYVLLIASAAIPNIYFSSNLQEQSVTDETLRQDPRNLTWIKERGCYFCLRKTLYMKFFVVQVILLLFFTIGWMIFMFAHMNRILNSDNHIRNSQTTKNIRKSIVRLFFQLITPLLLMAIPATIIIVALATDGLIEGFSGLLTFEQSLSLFIAILCHPIVHNILLISLTPAYRSKIINTLKRIVIFKSCQGKPVSQKQTVSIAPFDTITSHRFIKI